MYKGLYNKYTVINNATGQPVEDFVFVLKITDPVARDAMVYYAQATDNPELATELEIVVMEYEEAHSGD